MRRGITIDDRRKWLAEYERGRPVAAIASKYRRDVRTIEKHIDKTRREQDVRIARAELMKEAPRRHQDSLEGELRQILGRLEYPSADFAPLSWHEGAGSVFAAMEVSRVAAKGARIPRAGRKPAGKRTTARDMLKQHLKRDKLWKRLEQWEKDLAAHLGDREALQKKTVAILGEKTGYEMVDKADIDPPFLYSYTVGDLFYRSALDSALGSRRSLNIEEDITADTDRGMVMHHGSTLAQAPGAEEEARKSIIAAWKDILALPELKQVASSWETLKESADKVNQAVENILLLGFIEGRCDVCKRLGL